MHTTQTTRMEFPPSNRYPAARTIATSFICVIISLLIFFGVRYLLTRVELEDPAYAVDNVAALAYLNYILTYGFIFLNLSIIAFQYFYSLAYLKRFHYQISNSDITVSGGVIFKFQIVLPLNRLQSVNLYQGIVARVFGLYQVYVDSASEGGLVFLLMEKAAAESLKDKLNTFMRSARGPAPSSVAPVS